MTVRTIYPESCFSRTELYNLNVLVGFDVLYFQIYNPTDCALQSDIPIDIFKFQKLTIDKSIFLSFGEN